MKEVFFNKIKKEELKTGDHIYTWRFGYLYAHHGIYVDDCKVIHFTPRGGGEIGTGTFLDRIIFRSSRSHSGPQCPRCGDRPRGDGVISSCLDCFLSGGKLYRFRYGVSPGIFLVNVRGTCTFATSDPQEDVIHRAEILINNGFGDYNLFKNNCEDFAIYCKTGYRFLRNVAIGRSGQAASVAAAATALASSPIRLISTTGVAAVGCGIYCANRFISDIGVRKDVMKIPAERLVHRTRLMNV